VSPLHTKEDHGERLQVHAKTQEKVSPLLGDPVILTDRGPWYHDSVIRGSRASRTTCTRPSDFVARLSASGLPQGGDEGVLQQHQSQEDAVHTIRGLLGSFRCVVHGVEVTRMNAYPDRITPCAEDI